MCAPVHGLADMGHVCRFTARVRPQHCQCIVLASCCMRRSRQRYPRRCTACWRSWRSHMGHLVSGHDG